jgi:hydroxymethylpyrimidine pyrophosphatase-like HAD family hydrolase
MDNSYPGVKEHADWIAPSNDEDGVVDVVKRFVL